MWPKPGESLSLSRLSNSTCEHVRLECVILRQCITESALRHQRAICQRVFSGSAPTKFTKLYRLCLAAQSDTTETHPSGEFQNVSCTFTNTSGVQTCSHMNSHSLRIYLVSLVWIGTSLTAQIFKDGPCNIFLIVPEVDLQTDSVIIQSIRSGKFNCCVLSDIESKVLKPLDCDNGNFLSVQSGYLSRLSSFCCLFDVYLSIFCQAARSLSYSTGVCDQRHSESNKLTSSIGFNRFLFFRNSSEATAVSILSTTKFSL